ncbi:MAG: ABC transporter substrate-binding protein [Phycisphaerales bacterium]
MTRRLSWLLVIGALIVLLGSCERASSDAEPPAPAHQARIAALSPALAIILRDLGASDHVVARHAFDMALEDSLPVAGDQTGIDYETLLRVRPTHIALEWGSRELPPRLLTLAKDRGWTVRSFPMLTLEEIRRATRELGAIADASAQAEVMVRRMDAAWTASGDLGTRAGRTLTLYSVRPAGAAGPGSFHVQLLQSLGVLSVPEAGNPFISLDGEDLRRLDPDTIIVLAPGAEESRLAEFTDPLRTLGLRAALSDRVIIDTNPENQTPSTAMVGLAERLREGLARLELKNVERTP